MEQNENEGGLTENVFINSDNPKIPELQEASSNLKKYKKKIKLIIIISLIIIFSLALILILFFTLKSEKEDKQDEIPYSPIPQNEDLKFTEEAHRQLSREIAA